MRKNPEERRIWFNNRRKERIDFLREYKSGKSCSHCGYNEYTEILQFHHLDPSLKTTGMSMGGIGNYSMKKLQEEIDKCILLCPNCHSWLHYKENVICRVEQSGSSVGS